MKNLAFVIWMLGWSIICGLSDADGFAIVVQIGIWIIIGKILYEK